MGRSAFTFKIRNWYSENKRPLPWRLTRDPYKIWLSEVLLQQTRVQQGLPYYLKFIAYYPTVYHLAEADEESVLKLWQGLGYYSRARNLLKAAKLVVRDFNGVFPETYDGLKTLPGIGDYTASAIASICHHRPEPVLDGNVYRVLARYFGVQLAVNAPGSAKHFKELAASVMDTDQPGEYNQAIMEFGAVCCKPRQPQCSACPLADTCSALQKGMVSTLPLKLKKGRVRKRYFNYVVLRDPDRNTLMEKRKGQGIWQNMYQFPLVESETEISGEELAAEIGERWSGYNPGHICETDSEYITHKLSHQHLKTKFWVLPLGEEIEGGISLEEAEKLPLPVLVADSIKTLKNSYF